MSKHINSNKRRDLLRLIGFSEERLPVTYLRTPLISRRMNRWMLEPLVQKVWSTVENWKGMLISQGGRLILICHVLSCIVTRVLAVLPVHVFVVKKINSIMATFLWGESNGKAKWKWDSCFKLCKPIEGRGIGVRDIWEVQKAFFIEFARRLLSVDNLWTKFFLAKYVQNRHICSINQPPVRSRFWKAILKVLPKVYENCYVTIWDGKFSFWFDKWLWSSPLVERVRYIQNSRLKI